MTAQNLLSDIQIRAHATMMGECHAHGWYKPEAPKEWKYDRFQRFAHRDAYDRAHEAQLTQYEAEGKNVGDVRDAVNAAGGYSTPGVRPRTRKAA